MPVKVGLSLADYYELNTGTAAAPVSSTTHSATSASPGIVTVPLGGTTSFGTWNVHGGVEFQALGDTTEALNGGDGHRVIGSVGIGLLRTQAVDERSARCLTVGMVVLGLVTFAAMLGFVALCDRV